jgi:sRNA-binding carbon storage regulator CsrA
MLALAIDKQDGLIIGKNIRLTLGDISPNRVQVLIEAPEDVPVYRQRLLERLLGPQAFRQFLHALKAACRRKTPRPAPQRK